MSSALADVLASGLDALGLSLSPAQQEALLQYQALFMKWNRAYNLSAIRDPESMVRLHLLDSLAVAPHLEGERFIDVGTGGGLPGIPLAIAFPQRHFTLLDSAGKKTRFLVQVKQSLGLASVQVLNTRVEAYRPEPLYDGVISRAFASLADMTQSCGHLLHPQGRFWAMKGVYPEAELSQMQKHYIVQRTIPLQVPGLDAERCLLVLQATPET